MKSKLIIIIGLITFLLLGCPEPTETNDNSINNSQTKPTPEPKPIGETEDILLIDSSETIKMIYANNDTSTVFPVSEDNTRTLLNSKFWIAETEFTNAQAIIVLQWSFSQGYFSLNVDDHNGLDNTTIKYGGHELLDIDDSNCQIDFDENTNSFYVQTGYENHPVTNITWYGAVMICNWLTEMQDGNKDNLVYSNIDSTWEDEDWDTAQDLSKTGFRLPTPNEWEYAARYRGTDTTNTIDGFSNPYYTKEDSMSGADASHLYTANSKAVAVYKAYQNDPTDEQEVKSLGENSCNTLGIFDMSGNVEEWCFQPMNDMHEKRGGAWNTISDYCIVTGTIQEFSSSDIANLGFRVYRSEK